MKTSIAALSVAFALVLVAGALPAFAANPPQVYWNSQYLVVTVESLSHQPIAGASIVTNTGGVFVTDLNGQAQIPYLVTVTETVPAVGLTSTTLVSETFVQSNYWVAVSANGFLLQYHLLNAPADNSEPLTATNIFLFAA